MSPTIRSLWLALLLALAACGESAQTATARKVDQPPWEGPATAFTAPGWKPGDRASWTDEIRQRAQGQNENVRINR